MGVSGSSTPLPGNPTMLQGSQTDQTLGLIGFQTLKVYNSGSTPTKTGKKKGKKVMAATSTNKQPLLVDHVPHYAVNLDTSINDGLDIVGTNTATLIIDSTSQDGAIVEDVYTIARGTTPTQ